MAQKLGKFLKSLDIFGYPIGVHYKGSDTYQTRLGAVCTFLAYVLMAFNSFTMTTEFLNHTFQEEKQQSMLVDSYKTPVYSFEDHNFEISALSTMPLDPRYG